MVKQSLTDRAARLERGCCPIHGGWMGQVDRWYYPEDDLELNPPVRNAYETLKQAGDALGFAGWERVSGLTHSALWDVLKELRERGLVVAEGDGLYRARPPRPYTIVGCPRGVCGVRAKAFSIDGPWELLPEFAPLLT